MLAKKVENVTKKNFARAETCGYMKNVLKRVEVCEFWEKPYADLKHQLVVHENQDTCYFIAVVHRAKIIVTPKLYSPYLSVSVINQDHSLVKVIYGGVYKIKPEKSGTPYSLVLVRLRPNKKGKCSLKGLVKLKKCQKDDLPLLQNFNKVQLANVKKQILANVSPNLISDDLFGTDMTTENRNIGAAFGWGGLTPRHAQYFSFKSKPGLKVNLSKLKTRRTGFVSLQVYDKKGFIPLKGTTYIQDPKKPIVIGKDTVVGDTFTVRVYLPRKRYSKEKIILQ